MNRWKYLWFAMFEQSRVIVRIEFTDNTSEEFLTDLMISSEMTPLMWILLILPIAIGFIALLRLKKERGDGEA